MVPLAGDSGAGRPAHNTEARQAVTVRHQRRHPGQHAEKSISASRQRAWPRRRARGKRARPRAVPELAEIEKDAAPAITTEEDDDEASLDLVEDYTYVNPFDVHRFWNREVFVTPPGEQCARWQLRRVRLATEVETGFPFLLHGVPAPLESPIPFAAASCEVPSWLNTSARRRNRDDVASMA